VKDVQLSMVTVSEFLSIVTLRLNVDLATTDHSPP